MAALGLLQQARHKLWVYSRDLDPELLCSESALTELRRLALSGRGADLRLLVQDPGAALRQAAKLISLAQRASTTVAIRAPVEDVDLNFPSAFLLNDVGGYLFRPLGGRFEGSTHSNAHGRNRQLHDVFNQIWERSVAPTEVRALKL